VTACCDGVVGKEVLRRIDIMFIIGVSGTPEEAHPGVTVGA